MKQFSFGTFLVDETNREAFETCRKIANLEYESTKPLLILADKGCGKTHLLYAVVNRTRANSATTGIACINAVDFPEKVLGLIMDPSPVKRAQSAILLVDDLDRFRERLDEVEGVVRIFLDHGHAVIISLSIHPSRLTHLPEGLKGLLSETKIVTILPESSSVRVERIERDAKEQNDTLIASLHSEIELLKEQLASGHGSEARGDGGREEEIDGLRKALEEKEEACASLEGDLENAAAENALLEVSAKENAPLRRTIEDLQDRLDETVADADGIAQLHRSIEELRKALDEEKARAEAAETKAQEIESHAESLLEEVDRSRALFAEAKREQDNLLSDIRQLQAVLTGDEIERALPPSFGTEVAGLQEEIARITDERDNARRDLTQLMDETQSARDEISGLGETVAHGVGELDALKRAPPNSKANAMHLRKNWRCWERKKTASSRT